MIPGYSQEDFGAQLHKHIKPSKPVDTPELLQGRHEELAEIKRALYAMGRHVFIYGDRGVGKSSLAQTAAYQYQSADRSILRIGCTRETSFYSELQALATQLIKDAQISEVTHTARLNLKAIDLERTSKTTRQSMMPAVKSMDDALAVINDINQIHSDKPIIVVDEFDAIEEQRERFLFADLLKKMGDSGIYVPMIFTGIASSLDDLLGGHQSSIRQLKPIHLDPLSWDARWDIFLKACDAFAIEPHPEIKYRIAGISDGFPYYVHLITEHLLWKVFDDPHVTCKATMDQYREALDRAVGDVQAHIRKPYDYATMRESDDYHYVIWAAADSSFLLRRTRDMYESYKRIISDLERVDEDAFLDMLTYEKFATRIRQLSKSSHGSILRKLENKTGWYQFSENMLRGFVKLMAETFGIQLWVEEAPTPRQYMSVPSSRISKGKYHGPRIPQHIRFKGERKSRQRS